jgi:hypothetical protein
MGIGGGIKRDHLRPGRERTGNCRERQERLNPAEKTEGCLGRSPPTLFVRFSVLHSVILSYLFSLLSAARAHFLERFVPAEVAVTDPSARELEKVYGIFTYFWLMSWSRLQRSGRFCCLGVTFSS